MGEPISGVARLVSSNFWVGNTPLPYLIVLGQDSVLFPEVEQLHGHRCYSVLSYHFGKLLSSQTTLFEQIFDFGPRPRIAGVKRGAWRGV